MRVAYLDMTNSSHQCPSGLRLRTESNVRMCAAYDDSATCSSVPYSSNGIHYSKVCGSIRGYHDDTMNGFSGPLTIDSNYVDGVSLTHGRAPRQHIWTFAVHYAGCPCGTPPLFVGNDYFCDVGKAGTYDIDLSDLMWDGENCGTNTCCTFNNPPWFYKQLPQPTADNIEMRVCRNQERHNEDVLLETIEIYVQ